MEEGGLAVAGHRQRADPDHRQELRVVGAVDRDGERLAIAGHAGRADGPGGAQGLGCGGAACGSTTIAFPLIASAGSMACPPARAASRR